ncbi:hypothetical protein C7E12_22120, partial [Stenotrophomonas maltophilia]
DDTMALLGNYFGTPAAPVTILQGVREAAKGVEVRYARGVDLVGPTADDTMALLGNYFGTPAAPVTILQGVREAAKGVEV